MRQRLLRVGKACHLLVGIFVAQFVEREGERLAETQGFRDRLRRVAEQPRHFLWRLEVAFGVCRKLAPGAVDGCLLADAGEHVGERPPVGVMEMHVVDRDQRHLRRARQFFAVREPCPVTPAIKHGGGQPHAAGRRGAQPL